VAEVLSHLQPLRNEQLTKLFEIVVREMTQYESTHGYAMS
jgi:hypothetical protein